MTGFLTWTLGSSFLNASGVAFHSIFGSSRPPPTFVFVRSAGARPVSAAVSDAITDMSVLLISVEPFGEWAECERREVGQADQDQDHGDEHADEERLSRIQCADAGGHPALSSQRPGQAEREDLWREPAEQHHDAADGVVPDGVRGQ